MSRDDAVLVVRDGLAVEYVAALDRYTWFGPEDGPNLLHVEGLERERAAEEGYTFYGGCYTWVSPQRWWVGPDGASREWPPDPSMDVGPGAVVGRGAGVISSRTPRSRQGLVEEKRFEIDGPRTARLVFGLVNEGAAPVECGGWVNTAVARGGVMALRYVEGVTDVWGWDEATVARFKGLLEPVEGTEWVVVDLSRADWEGGGKVWIDTAGEIAVWRDGWWLHRRVVGEVDAGRLRAIGEGPVAVYIQPGGDWIVEAELYGPAATLAPGERVFMEEEWRVVRGARTDVGGLR